MNYQEIFTKHIWQPYTQHAEYGDSLPLFIERAEGIKLFDREGNFYYDTISSWWCNLLGHRHPVIARALEEQLSRLDHTLFAGIVHSPALELVERLSQRMPSHLSRYFFSDNGSTAIEVAIKMSLQYWKMRGEDRSLFVFLDHGYHGDTIGAMSVSGVSQFNRYFRQLFFPAKMIPSPADDLDRAIEELEALCQRGGDRISAVLIEPLLQGAGGMRFYSPRFLSELERLRRKWGFHVICDEIAVGFWRLGRFLAHTHTELEPDFVCLSKALTNGMLPLALTITREEIYREFLGDYADRTFFHGHTYTANPLACACACATLEVLDGMEDPASEVRRIEAHLKDLGEELRSEFPRLTNVANAGLVWRAEVRGADREEVLSIYRSGLRHHILVRPLGSVIYLFLPLITSDKELEFIGRALSNTLKETIA